MPIKQNPANRFKAELMLKDLGLPFIDVILTERFLLPPTALKKIGEPVPETLGQLATMSGMPPADVMAIIDECLELDRDLRVKVKDLESECLKEGVILLDMRPGIEIDTEPLHADAKLFHAQNIQSFLPYLKTLQKVLVISHSDEHAWSAAVSLKKMGIAAVIPVTSDP